MARMIPYAYRPGNSVMHRCPGAVKLGGLLGMSGAVFFFGPQALCVCTGILILLSLAAGIRPWELLRGSRNLMFMLLFMLLFRAVRADPPAPDRTAIMAGILRFNALGAIPALLFSWSMLLSFSAGALLFSVTTMTELRVSIACLERALLGGLIFLLKRFPSPPARQWARELEPWQRQPPLSLGISLMLGFLPCFFEVWESADAAWAARGGKRGIRAMAVLIPLATGRMMERAAETALALDARGL